MVHLFLIIYFLLIIILYLPLVINLIHLFRTYVIGLLKFLWDVLLLLNKTFSWSLLKLLARFLNLAFPLTHTLSI